jgi:hypothetical protein
VGDVGGVGTGVAVGSGDGVTVGGQQAARSRPARTRHALETFVIEFLQSLCSRYARSVTLNPTDIQRQVDPEHTSSPDLALQFDVPAMALG